MAVPWTLNDRHQTMHCDMIPGGAVLPSSKQSLPLMNTLQRLNDGQVSCRTSNIKRLLAGHCVDLFHIPWAPIYILPCRSC